MAAATAPPVASSLMISCFLCGPLPRPPTGARGLAASGAGPPGGGGGRSEQEEADRKDGKLPPPNIIPSSSSPQLQSDREWGPCRGPLLHRVSPRNGASSADRDLSAEASSYPVNQPPPPASPALRGLSSLSEMQGDDENSSQPSRVSSSSSSEQRGARSARLL
ncbi:hypothetical protein NQZ68_015168 [Dissostichus eleginoides]|nr:hypothetical protein NQZ68_015168 [Dissostichus eleginoides]